MGIPEHGRYFENRLKEIKSTLRGRGGDVEYDRERVHCFEVMRQLPTPQIVRVLGETLDDAEDQPAIPVEGQDYGDHVANNKMAADALWQMIEKPPLQGKPTFFFDHDVETWKLWYAQVKAGTRGFQFKGDSTVHYLAKPKETGRPPMEESRATPAPSPVREQKQEPPTKAEVSTERPFPLVPTLIASILLISSAGWLVVSKRRGIP